MAGILDQIEEIRHHIEQQAGSEITQQVLEGIETLKDSSKPLKVAAWMQGAMERLDRLTDEETRSQIMIECGYTCALINKGVIEKGKTRRRKFATEEAFIEAEVENPAPGTRLVRDEDTLIQYYTPRSFTHPMRCYCSLWRGLPDDRQTSLTYCHCSQGFVQKFWEGVLGRLPVVEMVESCISGTAECKFVIHLKPHNT